MKRIQNREGLLSLKEKKKARKQAEVHSGGPLPAGSRRRPLVLALCAVFLIAALLLAGGCGSSDKKDSINVFNWGEYIDPTLLTTFEEETGIKVNYTTVATCEEMYAKMKNGGVAYDIVVPSDYMISRMIEEDMLAEIDFGNVPNFRYVDEEFRHLEYDPENAYTVPYQWGSVGIIYNKEVVSENEKDLGSWDLLWNKKYKKQILMFESPRDSLGIALKKLGESYNTTDEETIRKAGKLLMDQKPLVQAYVVDQIFDKIESGEAAISPCYAGDYILICDEMGENAEETLGFYVPDEGSNFFVDAMCIPKDAENKEGAESFINFICEPENMELNTEFIYYSTAESAARELLPDYMKNSLVMYPDEDVMSRLETYINLPVNCRRLYDTLWIQLMSA